MKSALLIVRRLVLPEEDSRTRIDQDIPPMNVEDRDSLERLQEAAKQCRNTRAWPRVQAVSLAKQGDTAPEIARALRVSRGGVQTRAEPLGAAVTPIHPDHVRSPGPIDA